MQFPNLPLNFTPTIPKEKVSKAWTAEEKQTVLTLGATGHKIDQIIPYVPHRTRASIQAVLNRDLPKFKAQQSAQQVVQQHGLINNQMPSLPQPQPQPQLQMPAGIGGKSMKIIDFLSQ